MKNLARCALLLTLTATLVLTLVGPASAGQIIRYRGTTSQDEQMSLRVLKRDSGRRFLRGGWLYFTTNCEDPNREVFGIGIAKAKMDDAGAFHIERRNEGIFSYSFTIDGVVRWGGASGTFEFNYATLTEDDQAELCTTGLLDWSADRRRSTTAGPLPMSRHVTMLRVGNGGELRVIEP